MAEPKMSFEDSTETLEDLEEEGSREKDLPAADLSVTAAAFAIRMRKRMKEQQEAVGTAEREASVRQQLVLKSMVKIRKSLEEVARIDLGERFQMRLEKDDLNGWPRLTIRLHDELKPNGDYPIFQVIAHDRQARGAIEICFLPDRPYELMCLSRELDYKRLPTVLKKCVRAYLDRVGEIVIEAEKNIEELLDSEAMRQTEVIEGDPAPAPAAAITSPEGEDFYDDGYAARDEFEKLPELEHIDSLPCSLDIE